MIENAIIVRLEVEHMKQQILHAFSERQAWLKAELEAKLDAALKSLDWEAEINRALSEAIRESTRRAIEFGIQRAFADNRISNKIEEMALVALRKVTKDRW